jgi:4-amino-4-deoxy-L-arabinose transferase-like glycosyltransferase
MNISSAPTAATTGTSADRASRRAWYLLALLAFALCWFGTLEYRQLVRPDEGRYAEIPREMVASGDWLTPRLNAIKYFEKPALQYWATAVAYETFGVHQWTSRLWTALTGFLGVLLAVVAGRRLFGPAAGLFAGITLASSLLYALMAHIDTLDIGFTFFVEAALFGFLLAQDGGRRWMWLAWVGLALAVLSKGIVALVITGAALILYSLATRDFSPWRKLELARGLPLFLLIAAPWFVAVSLANPEFPRFFFIHEHFERFLTKVHRRYGPWWYFIPIFAIGMLPWTTLALQSLWQAWRQHANAAFQPRRFLAVWCLLVFVFFSISDSKLPPYILPIFPALALLLGDQLARIGRKALAAHLAGAAAVALAATLLLPHITDLADEVTPLPMIMAYRDWLMVSAATWLAGSLAAALLAWRGRTVAAVLTAGATAFIGSQGALLGHNELAPAFSGHDLAGQVKPLLTPDVPIYSVDTYDQTLPFYLARPVTLVAKEDELAFGLAQEPGKWIPTMAEFARRWQADADAFAIIEPDTFDTLQRQGLPMTVVARDARRLIVRKPKS